jgi:hypothetical protein
MDPLPLAVMRVAEFYEHFERAFTVASLSSRLRRLKSEEPRWKIAASNGTVSFRFSTNSKSAGLLPLLYPGEFRPLFIWRHDTPRGKISDDVSFFQYTDPAKVKEAVELQRIALDKYLGNRRAGPAERINWVERHGALDEPQPNIERSFYYFDSADAETWGTYFGGSMRVWLRRFNERPESMYGWCCRVLWNDPERVERER